MNIREELDKIWTKDYINSLPKFVAERGFVYSKNDKEKDILITGINPSFRQGADLISYDFDFGKTLNETKWDNYWGPLKKIVFDCDNGIDLKNRTSYIDIFYFREKEQKQLKNGILKNTRGIEFLVDQLNITQYIIEEIIKPKVIIVKNKESAAYWGKLAEQGIIWMGYKFEYLESFNCGELFEISGLIDSPERISDKNKTNLKGSLILFSEHISQYTKREKRPTALLINELLEKYTKRRTGIENTSPQHFV
ncbi:hypothetical protein [Maribellus maritimus]|jgi:hypothetical protein|uniref:hypothetical protein n=1 Tax=Maribellus maritimus TaxID=2870838 RepID=UPI001EEBD7C6|nr:hypothetical protein [Maribellus maritimus]MCG6191400.1 hypothetical protein [Maribellus maritimus]